MIITPLKTPLYIEILVINLKSYRMCEIMK